MADTFLKIGTSFPQGAFRPDGQPNIPSQAYADYLAANPMTPRADPVGYVAPSEEQSIFTEYNQEPLSNYGFTEAEEYLRSAGKSFKNAVTGQGVATLLPEMQFYPYGPTGAEYVYGGVADAGLGIFSSIVAGLSGAAGFVAEQIPFQTEAEEDRFARDALGMLEFAEVQYLPLAGMFSQIGQLAKASKVTTAAAKAPEVAPDFPIEAQEFDGLLDNLDNINFDEIDEAPSLSMEELGARLRAQQPDELTDDELNDALAELIQEETDPEVLINNALLEREATGATFTPEDDQLLNDLELTDADFSEIDEANASYDRIMNERIDVALDSRPEFQDPSVRLGVQSLRESGSSVDQIERYLDDIRRAKGPVYQISEAEFADQLRDLYERSNLPIPKNDAEERAADLIIQVAAGEKVTPSLRRGVDVDYLQANAPETVFNQAKPTIQETLEAERQYGILNNVSVGQETDIGALTGGLRAYNSVPAFSPSMKAAESLPQEKGAYKSLKKWMLKNGAKAKELEWSGADEAFEGRTDVTKTELIQYLNENKDLVEAERKVAQGVLRSEGGDTRVAVENYIENNLADTAYYLRENFEQDWEYSTQLESISDYVAAGDYEGLDQIAEFMDGVEDGAALAEKYPDGWIGDYNPMNRQWSIYADKDSAIRHDAPDFDDMARESLRESLDEMEQYDPEEYGRMVFGDAGASADTSELEYTQYFPSGGTNTTETTYQFRDPTGRLPDDYFTEAHFGETGRDTNLVAHVRTAEFPVDGGGTAFHVGEIQSDAAQSLREKNKQTGEVKKYAPRTREQEIQMGQIEYLTEQLGDETRGAENLLNQMVFGDDVGMNTPWRRDGYPEQLETYKTIIADFKNKQSGIDGFEGYEPDQIKSEATFFEDSLGSIENMGSELDAFAQYIKDVADDVPPEYVEWADSYIQNIVPKIDSLSSGLRRFDNQDFSKTRTGAPFIESTDAWVNMTLKRQLMDAVESGADYITLPNPEMVKKYTYGDIEGHRAFYGEIAPSNLLDIAKSYDPDAKLVGKLIETEAAVESVTALPLTRRLVEAMMEKGVSTYAVPLAVGAGAGYGALDQVGGENGQSGS